MSPQPGRELRIGDAEREAAVSALGEHFAAGRLTKDEYDERSDRAWAARTGSQLAPLFADLPRAEGPTRPAGPAGPAGPAYGRGGPGRPGHPGWRFGAVAVPLLVVLGVVTLILHLPVVLLVLLVWLVLSRSGRHWAWRSRYRRERWAAHHHGYGG